MSKPFTYRVASNPVHAKPGELAVLFAGDSQTKPGHRVGPRVVDYYLLHHVMSGKGKLRSGDFEAELAAGHTFLIRPEQLVQYASDEEEPWRYRWVAFFGASAEALLEEAGLGEGRIVVRSDNGKAQSDRCKAIYEAFRTRLPSASLEATGHLHLLLAGLQEAASDGLAAPVKPDSHADELVRQVVDYLSTQYAEPITIESMAESLGYNRAYLSRVFKQRTSLSPVTFLTKLRIDHGRRLLRERPELTVEQIASSAGIQDALYFSKQFRRWYGQSPTEYRLSVVAGKPKGR